MNQNDLANIMSNIHGWLSLKEGNFLYHMAKKISAKGAIVEIGSYHGKSTVCLGLGVISSGTDRKIIAVDPHKGKIKDNGSLLKPSLSVFLRNIKKYKIDHLVKPEIMTSQQAAKQFNDKISFLFIDGLHDFKHARQDFLFWNKNVVDSGVIAMHDGYCGESGVMKAVEKILTNYQDIRQIGAVSSIFYFVKGKPSNFSEKILLKIRKRLLVISHIIYKNKFIPEIIKIFICHRAIKIFLTNKL